MKKHNKRVFNTQLFGSATKGKDIVYLLRLKSEQATENGAILAYTTNNNRNVSSGVGSSMTKDGPVATPGNTEETLSLTAYLSSGDEMADKLEAAIKESATIEVWEADLSQPQSQGKYAGTYWEALLSSFAKASPADSLVELSLEIVLEGGGKKGNVTVTDEQREEAYEFLDTTPTGV